MYLTIKKFLHNNIFSYPQKNIKSRKRYFKKRNAKDEKIDWSKNIKDIYNLINKNEPIINFNKNEASEGYKIMVLNNPKQFLIYELSYRFNENLQFYFQKENFFNNHLRKAIYFHILSYFLCKFDQSYP